MMSQMNAPIQRYRNGHKDPDSYYQWGKLFSYQKDKVFGYLYLGSERSYDDSDSSLMFPVGINVILLFRIHKIVT